MAQTNDLTIRPAVLEWPTLAILAATYATLAVSTTVIYDFSAMLGVILTGIAIGQFSSLQHEALHDHPFRNATANEIAVFPALTLTVPYRRFKETHLAHHHDPVLTDPYDDPESCYCDPKIWATFTPSLKRLLRANNTLLGRIVIGPALSNVIWLRDEFQLFVENAPGVRLAWLLHLAGFVPLVVWLSYAPMPWWAYLVAAYIGHGLLKIRTFLEHRAHELARARTVIIEDRGPLALLFLNNNFHAVHHAHPAVAWYRLPTLYRARQSHFLRRNAGYVYRSYAQIFAKHLLWAKEPVAHPLMQDDTLP